MQPAPLRWVGSVPGSGHSGQGPPLPAGTGVMPGCAQLLGRRPTVCKELGEQPPSRSCENNGWASREIYPRMGVCLAPRPGPSTPMQVASLRALFPHFTLGRELPWDGEIGPLK